MSEYSDITFDIIVNQLINETLKSEEGNYLWKRVEYPVYNEYKYIIKLNESINLVFKLFSPKLHDGSYLNIYLNKMRGVANIGIHTLYDKKVKDLLKIIENSKKFYENKDEIVVDFI